MESLAQLNLENFPDARQGHLQGKWLAGWLGAFRPREEISLAPGIKFRLARDRNVSAAFRPSRLSRFSARFLFLFGRFHQPSTRQPDGNANFNDLFRGSAEPPEISDRQNLLAGSSSLLYSFVVVVVVNSDDLAKNGEKVPPFLFFFFFFALLSTRARLHSKAVEGKTRTKQGEKYFFRSQRYFVTMFK